MSAPRPGSVSWVLHPDILSSTKGPASARRPAARLEEAAGLARAVALDVDATEVLTVRRTRPATLFGPGLVVALAERLDIAAQRPDVVVVNTALSAVQQRNLERRWRVKVLDRTALILEIFGARARTREGRLQVELAALSYQRSRLVRTWTHLERQRGGLGFVGGPGESQLEVDRRRIDERITQLRRALAAVARTRGLHRAARLRVPYPDRLSRRLHERRKINPVQPFDGRRGRRGRPAVRNAGPDDAGARSPLRAHRHSIRYRRFRCRPADRSDRRVPRHAGGSRPRRSDRACSRHHPSRQQRPARRRGRRACRPGRRARSPTRRVLEVHNKIDLLDAEARDALRTQIAGA